MNKANAKKLLFEAGIIGQKDWPMAPVNFIRCDRGRYDLEVSVDGSKLDAFADAVAIEAVQRFAATLIIADGKIWSGVSDDQFVEIKQSGHQKHILRYYGGSVTPDRIKTL